MTAYKEESLGQSLAVIVRHIIFELKNYNKNECSLTIVKCLSYCIFSLISLESVTAEGQSEKLLSIWPQFELLLFLNQRSLTYFTKWLLMTMGWIFWIEKEDNILHLTVEGIISFVT